MRIFLSHGSTDKSTYCDAVAERLVEALGADSIVYDAITFETGERSVDEIERTLGISDLYVIFLSSNAIERKWVKFELREAHKKFTEKTLNRIFPIIIDSELKYSDPRIPDWLKEYNLKYIKRPAKAAKLIIERAKDTNWVLHPISKIKNSVFVGRNDLISDFETRNDDFDLPPLNTFIVSGLPNIGRKSLVRHCFIKGTIIPQYYDFPSISLSYQESIEDFILKISDLGFSEKCQPNELASKTVDQKIELAISYSKEILDISEIILIKDDRCIIDYRGTLAQWFVDIITAKELQKRMLFVIITKYKINFESVRHVPYVTYTNVPELSQPERKGLLQRLIKIYDLDLCRDELENISRYLTGYPEQVQYAVSIIKEKGYPYLAKNLKLLSDYNEQEVSSLLNQHRGNSKVLEILALISKYDAISVEMLYSILETTSGYVECYENLYQESFFELEGVNKEYVRLNEVVRNYVARSGLKVSPMHSLAASRLFEKMFSNNASAWYNSNDYLLAIREKVTHGKFVDPEHIIPSVYLKSMSDLYSNMQYENVVKLADRALGNSDNTDEKIIYEIRYLLCSALAKLKDTRCLTEVRKLDYDDGRFLTAFFYRQTGKNDRALKCLNELLAKREDMSKAKREKVLVLKNLQQFEQATDLAKENYYQHSDNPYHIQAYFDCLINTYYNNPEDDLLIDLVEKIHRIQSEKAQSMYGRCYALYLAYVEKDYENAIIEIDSAVQDFPKDKRYALTVKFDIARLFRHYDEMESVISELEKDGANNNTIVICKSKLMADRNQIERAIEYFMKNISYFTDESKTAFCDKLRNRSVSL